MIPDFDDFNKLIESAVAAVLFSAGSGDDLLKEVEPVSVEIVPDTKIQIPTSCGTNWETDGSLNNFKGSRTSRGDTP